jgi:hypothetical protein
MTLGRAGAIAGVMGGVLRAASSFAPDVIASQTARELLYLVIDVCLLAGLVGVYWPQRRRTSVTGLSGFALAVIGLVLVRTRRAITTVDLYPAAAAAVAIGVTLLSFSEWTARRMAGWIPLALACSVAIGAISVAAPAWGALFVWSGVVFGIGFAGMCLSAWRHRSS